MAKEPIQTAQTSLDEHGREVLDTTVPSLPLRFQRLANEVDNVRRMIREELSRIAEKEKLGSFEEEDDFDVGDDYDPTSPYELDEVNLEYDHTRDSPGSGGSDGSLNATGERPAEGGKFDRSEEAPGPEGSSDGEGPPADTPPKPAGAGRRRKE